MADQPESRTPARIERERRTLAAMIGLYCRAHHGGGEADRLCAACAELHAYARARLERCPFGSDKPACSRCTTHCYKPVMRARIREVMRFAGPRMLTRHPVLALHHLRDNRRHPHPTPENRPCPSPSSP